MPVVGPTTSMTKGERTRQALLDAAIVRFGRDGFRGTSVAEIARDARLSGTAAYVYFPNKEALFVAAVDEDAAAVIHEGLSTIIADPDADVEDWRQALLVTLVAAVDGHPLAKRLLAKIALRPLMFSAVEELARFRCSSVRCLSVRWR